MFNDIHNTNLEFHKWILINVTMSTLFYMYLYYLLIFTLKLSVLRAIVFSCSHCSEEWWELICCFLNIFKIYIYIYVYIHIYTYTYIHIYIIIHTYIHTYIYIYTHTHTYIYYIAYSGLELLSVMELICKFLCLVHNLLPSYVHSVCNYHPVL